MPARKDFRSSKTKAEEKAHRNTKALKFRIGDRVHWTDPDEDICSCDGNIVRKQGTNWVVLQDGGGEVSALPCELNHICSVAPTEHTLKCLAFERRQASRLMHLGYALTSLLNIEWSIRRERSIGRRTQHLYEVGNKRLLKVQSVITKLALDFDHQFRDFRV
jgi:hypothetical protein